MKKTILHLPIADAMRWCFETELAMQSLWMKEMQFRDRLNTFAAHSLQSLMGDGRRSANPHLKRAGELLRGECGLTRELLYFVANVRKMLKGEARTPFEQEMSQDEARSWLAEKRGLLKQKIRRERKYRASVPYPDTHAATEEESVMQEGIVLLLDELLKTYPPKKLPRPKE
jgi:hypothetical protein